MSGSNGPSQPRAKPRTTVRGQSYALEVGAFKGRSTVWLLENILTHPASTLTYVDTFAGGAEHASQDLTDLEARFRANTEPHRAKLVARKGPSAAMLRELPLGRYDFVSIDCSHKAADVLSDAVLSWPLVKPGGLVCFDEYDQRMHAILSTTGDEEDLGPADSVERKAIEIAGV